uniref:Uncharacterized protein n=1 Tax=Cannabis sativa TaxID=3483 RepID=A0A803QPN2_CANSA
MDVDLGNLFKSPPPADKISKKRIIQADDASDTAKGPKRTKTKANKRKSSHQLVIEADETPEVGNELPAMENEALAAEIEEQPTGPFVTNQQADLLLVEFTRDELKNVIFYIPFLKAPRPNGYNSFFFNDNMDIMGNDICDAIISFLLSW